ncbi:hypothetical protein ACOME3_000918 [Neoechinorhynchus agilis]
MSLGFSVPIVESGSVVTVNAESENDEFGDDWALFQINRYMIDTNNSQKLRRNLDSFFYPGTDKPRCLNVTSFSGIPMEDIGENANKQPNTQSIGTCGSSTTVRDLHSGKFQRFHLTSDLLDNIRLQLERCDSVAQADLQQSSGAPWSDSVASFLAEIAFAYRDEYSIPSSKISIWLPRPPKMYKPLDEAGGLLIWETGGDLQTQLTRHCLKSSHSGVFHKARRTNVPLFEAAETSYCQSVEIDRSKQHIQFYVSRGGSPSETMNHDYAYNAPIFLRNQMNQNEVIAQPFSACLHTHANIADCLMEFSECLKYKNNFKKSLHLLDVGTDEIDDCIATFALIQECLRTSTSY